MATPKGIETHRKPQQRFASFPVTRGFQEGRWEARRHGSFSGRVDPGEHMAFNTWPYNCRYYLPKIMDPTEAIDLNARDTEYSGDVEPVQCIKFGAQGPFSSSVQLGDRGTSPFDGLSKLSTPGSTVLFVSQCRVFYPRHATVQLGIGKRTWIDILTHLDIPPVVVELIHGNDGGTWQHISHCADNARAQHNPDGEYSGPCAYHISFKTSQYEMMYARYDFHTKRSLMLVLGSNLEVEIDRLMSQFQGLSDVHLLHIVLAVMSSWLQKLEQTRWSLYLAILRLEEGSGTARHFQQSQQPLPPDELMLLKANSVNIQGYVRAVARHSRLMGELMESFETAVTRLTALDRSHTDTSKQQLLDALHRYQSQQRSQANQAHDLSVRIDVQWSVQVALMAKHDTDVNLSMASDARTDSFLMRRMAAVSIVFLPATFLATFFSMMFFQVDGSGELSMNSNIWVYFAATSAMSLTIALYFRFGRRRRMLAVRLRRILQQLCCSTPSMEKVDGIV